VFGLIVPSLQYHSDSCICSILTDHGGSLCCKHAEHEQGWELSKGLWPGNASCNGPGHLATQGHGTLQERAVTGGQHVMTKTANARRTVVMTRVAGTLRAVNNEVMLLLLADQGAGGELIQHKQKLAQQQGLLDNTLYCVVLQLLQL
jgi:hypothetical protein